MRQRLYAIVVATGLLVCCVLTGASSREARSKYAEPQPPNGLDSVNAGDTKSFLVELENPPQFSGGRFQLLVGPFDEQQGELHPWCEKNLCRTSYTDIVQDLKTYTLTVQIPGDAPTGIWVAYIAFALPNGDFKEIAHEKRVRFQVINHPYSGLPLKVKRFALLQ
jgi:hypothetical protein